MVAGAPTVEVPSPARISRRSIALQRTLPDGSVRSGVPHTILWLMGCLNSQVSRCCRSGPSSPRAALIRHRRSGASFYLRRHIRHRKEDRRGARRHHQEELGPQAWCYWCVTYNSPSRAHAQIWHAVRELDLQKPIYLKTASYGHFGNPEYNWEKPKQLQL